MKKETSTLPGPSPQQGFTNMPLFGRVYKCKKQGTLEWKESVNDELNGVNSTEEKEDPKGTLVKHELTQTNQTSTKALVLRENDISKCLRSHYKDLGFP